MFLVAATLAVWWQLRGRGEGTEQATNEPPSARQATGGSSHDRMLALLQQIYDRTDSDNHWQGEGAAEWARRLLAELPEDADRLERRTLLLDVAEHELRLGNEEEALARFE